MKYRLDGYRNGKKIGSLRNSIGKIIFFETKTEAITIGNIESTQIENQGIAYMVVKIKKTK